MTDKLEIRGGCHCGHARYILHVSPSSLKHVDRCNCTFCNKLGNQGVKVDPGDFELLSPASPTELGDYYTEHPGTPNRMHRYFCSTCGTHLWMQGQYEFKGVHEIFQVSLRGIDQPQDAIDLSTLRFKYVDGLNDNFMAEMRDAPYPGGLV